MGKRNRKGKAKGGEEAEAEARVRAAMEAEMEAEMEAVAEAMDESDAEDIDEERDMEDEGEDEEGGSDYEEYEEDEDDEDGEDDDDDDEEEGEEEDDDDDDEDDVEDLEDEGANADMYMQPRKLLEAKGKDGAPAANGKKDTKAREERAQLTKRRKNKSRVLVLGSRGLTQRFRHLMMDIRNILPHHKKESKLDVKKSFYVINEVCELNACNSAIFFEVRKQKDLYMWCSRTPSGPSVKFHVTNIHTLDELRMTGNCLKYSRPLLTFDQGFDTEPHYKLLKELLTQVFASPRWHPKTKPFHDHVLSFHVADGRIWFRHFQVVEPEPHVPGGEPTLSEIGPRMVLQVIRIFGGSFGGPTLYQNQDFIAPNYIRTMAKRRKLGQYTKRIESNEKRAEYLSENPKPKDILEDVFRS